MNTAAIMTKHVYTIAPDQTLKDCAAVLREHHVNGLVVVNRETVVGSNHEDRYFQGLSAQRPYCPGRGRGVIPKAALSEAVLPGISESTDCGRRMPPFECIEERAHQLDNVKVRALMGTPAITITSDTPIVRAGSLMVFKG